MPILREWVDDDFPMRARGELSQKPTEEGWWQEGLNSNFMVHYAWMLHYGMDFTEQNHPYIDSEDLWSAHRFFNRHIHDKHLELAVGGFSYLRQELDSADKVLWPEEEFGDAKISNVDRMVAIAEWNSAQGARQGDPENGVGTQSNNRGARALNDVGWEVHAGNYEANLYQVCFQFSIDTNSHQLKALQIYKGKFTRWIQTKLALVFGELETSRMSCTGGLLEPSMGIPEGTRCTSNLIHHCGETFLWKRHEF